MMVEPDNVALEHLRAIRGETASLGTEMAALRAEVTTAHGLIVRMSVVAKQTLVELVDINASLVRIEKRLDLADA